MRRKQALRAEILRTARRLIEHRGYAHAKMRDIAGEAGISYQTLYNYFPAKSALVRALLTQERPDPAAQTERAERVGRADAKAPRDTPAGESLACRSDSSRFDCCGELRATILAAYDAANEPDRGLWRAVAQDALPSSYDDYTAFSLLHPAGPETVFRTLRRAHRSGALRIEQEVNTLAQLVCRVVDASLQQFLLQPALSRREALRALSRQLTLVLRPYLAELTERGKELTLAVSALEG